MRTAPGRLSRERAAARLQCLAPLPARRAWAPCGSCEWCWTLAEARPNSVAALFVALGRRMGQARGDA